MSTRRASGSLARSPRISLRKRFVAPVGSEGLVVDAEAHGVNALEAVRYELAFEPLAGDDRHVGGAAHRLHVRPGRRVRAVVPPAFLRERRDVAADRIGMVDVRAQRHAERGAHPARDERARKLEHVGSELANQRAHAKHVDAARGSSDRTACAEPRSARCGRPRRRASPRRAVRARRRSLHVRGAPHTAASCPGTSARPRRAPSRTRQGLAPACLSRAYQNRFSLVRLPGPSRRSRSPGASAS